MEVRYFWSTVCKAKGSIIFLVYHVHWKIREGHSSPLAVQILSFSCCFRWENYKIIDEHIHFWSSATTPPPPPPPPPLGKFWIRHTPCEVRERNSGSILEIFTSCAKRKEVKFYKSTLWHITAWRLFASIAFVLWSIFAWVWSICF